MYEEREKKEINKFYKLYTEVNTTDVVDSQLSGLNSYPNTKSPKSAHANLKIVMTTPLIRHL